MTQARLRRAGADGWGLSFGARGNIHVCARLSQTAARLFAASLDLSRCGGQLVPTMDLSDDEQAFLRDLVKASRQKIHSVKWIDRDGTDRQTTLTQAEAVRLNTIASRLGTSKSEVLRQAAHIPVTKLGLSQPKPSP